MKIKYKNQGKNCKKILKQKCDFRLIYIYYSIIYMYQAVTPAPVHTTH